VSLVSEAPATTENGHVDDHRDVLTKIADSAHRQVLTEPHRTDSGNAERLVRLHGDRLRFNHDPPRCWHVWDGVSWAPDRRGEAARLAKETATETLLRAGRMPDCEARTKLIAWALQSENAAKIEAALKVAQSHELNTGLMHLAAATGTSTIALNGPTSAQRWGPVGERVVSVNSDLAGCGFLNLGFEYNGQRTDCMHGISVERVAAETLAWAHV
jgi:Glycosyltransferase family 9 (heptosyltransferase)/D5 N terminal like